MAQGCTMALGGVYRGPPDAYRGPPEVYRGPCMKNMCWNQQLSFTSDCLRLRFSMFADTVRITNVCIIIIQIYHWRSRFQNSTTLALTVRE